MNPPTETTPLFETLPHAQSFVTEPIVTEQPEPSCSLWTSITSWGRKIKPILVPLTAGVVATTSLVASTVFLVEKHRRPDTDSPTDHAFEAICWSNLGISARVLLEALSSQNKAIYRRIQQLHNTTTGLAFWGFLALWNASLNVDKSNQKELYGAISAWFGYNVSNDCIQILKSLGDEFANLNGEEESEQEEHSSSIIEEGHSINIQEEDYSINHPEVEQPISVQEHVTLPREQEIPSIVSPQRRRKKVRPNLLLEPVFTDTPKVILYNAAKIALGIGATIFNNTYLNPHDKFYPLCNTFGYLLIGSGVGEVGMEGLVRLLKRVENFFNSPSNACHPRAKKIGLKAIKLAVEAVPVVVVELNILLEIFNEHNNYLGIPVGIAYSMTKHQAKREFQELTPKIEKHKKRRNQVAQTGCWHGMKDSKVLEALGIVEEDRRLRTAILVDRTITVPLYLGLTVFTAAVAVDADSLQDQIAISALLVSTLGVTGFGALLKKLFRPGKNSRLFNEIYFNVFENKEFLPLVYSFLTQISSIDDESIAKDTNLQFAFALLGMTTFGAMLGLDRVEASDSRRNLVLHTDPGYRMSSWLTFLMLFKGK